MDNKNDQYTCTSQRRICIATASWLCGMIDGISVTADDQKFSDALGEWLEIQLQKYDKIIIGQVQCNACGHKWNSVLFARNINQEICPCCGKQHASILLSPDNVPARTGNDAIRLGQLKDNGLELVTRLTKLQNEVVEMVQNNSTGEN